jgi:hypothetical protein
MATNQSLLTYVAKVSSVEDVYFSPVVTVSGVQLSSLYCFIGNVTPWPNGTPPVPTQDQYSIKQTMRNIISAKLISTGNIAPVVQRINWTTGTVYAYYSDLIDMFELDINGYLVNSFYVLNTYNQLFKCLWNNNGAASTVMPYFQPGSYNTNNIFQGTDGYKWKYIYSVTDGDVINFMDSNWIPIDVGVNTPNPIASLVGTGSIDVINVTNGGSGYDTVNSAISIVITGDGSGASANVGQVVNGVIQDIIVQTPGSNYNWADVAIVTANSSIGSGATVIAPISPVGGHGFDPVSELGCNHVMVSVEFNGNEAVNGIGMVPTDITYYQAGVVVNPTAKSLSPLPANSSIYDATTKLIVAAGFGLYVSGETVFQGSSLTAATYTGTVVDFDPASEVLSLINTTGSLTYNAPVFGNSSTTSRILLSATTPDYVVQSGYISYIENLTGIQRSSDGIEQFKFVLGY